MKLMKQRKRIMAFVVLCLTLTMLFALPVMAQSGSIGTFTKSGNTYQLPAINLSTYDEISLTFPNANGLSLVQGTVTFSQTGKTPVTKSFLNFSKTTWTWYASEIGTGTWNVTVSANSIGTNANVTGSTYAYK